MGADELRAAALMLSPKERAKLAHELLRSLDGPDDPDVEAAWLAEAVRRARELSDGAVQAVDWDVVRERVAHRLREQRR